MLDGARGKRARRSGKRLPVLGVVFVGFGQGTLEEAEDVVVDCCSGAEGEEGGKGYDG